ncbi:hypothetical protein E6Q11_04055 [Candidatus Dojkabacteria bacterium]|uniref:Prohead protease n=1 Tax=Candidatus Dojkabacteria bacterium TaxID=2099670 RepID=A0A5C7J5S7_9BACT|nr:MAG: hypothetical protein E6Q11_04055 [Candidatus Dojkabacteria bacterium]
MADTFRINIPISKVDEEQRIVTGIATSEALDSQGDIVDYEASKKAFADWIGIGNIREMHEPIAIGKAIDVSFDDSNKQVLVSAKISESKDGENAWTKVKEGVLSAFSIGGKIFEVAKDKAVEGANRIVDYSLTELSLVDNPANPEAQLIMVKGKTAKMTKTGNAILEVKKSVWDAQEALSAASQIAYLIMIESYENEPDQVADLIEAFNRLRDFAAKEVAEGDDYVLEGNEVMELASKAINLRKGNTMADKKVEKSTAVVAGEERNEDAEVVTTAEDNGRPVNDTEERAAESGVPVETGEEVTVKTEGEETAGETVEEVKEEEEEVVEDAKSTDETKEDGKEEKKSDTATDLVKSVQSLIAKMNENQAQDLTKVTDLVKSLGDKVEKSITSLEDRIKAIEDQPVATKAKASYVVSKGEDVADTKSLDALYKRQEELIANPSLAKPGEVMELATDIRTALREQTQS